MQYKFDDFQACLNQTFQLVEGDYSDELQLIQVDRLNDSKAMGGREAFSVLFQSRQPDVVPQQSYRLKNKQLGELQLFIVPVGQDESGVRYEAIFS